MSCFVRVCSFLITTRNFPEVLMLILRSTYFTKLLMRAMQNQRELTKYIFNYKMILKGNMHQKKYYIS